MKQENRETPDSHLRMKELARKLFVVVRNAARDLMKEKIVARVDEARDRFDREQLYVVVCGEFKVGKSSLINAFVEEPGLCPENTDVHTSMVSSIRYGPVERFTVVLDVNGQRQHKVITRDEIPEYVAEGLNPDNHRRVRLLIIEVPNPRLHNNLVMVDTPGVGGLNVRHTAATYDFIPKADAILYITNPKPLGTSDIDFLKYIDRFCKRVIFVVTRMDGHTAKSVEGVLTENRQEIAATLNRPVSDIEFIPVSSSLKFDAMNSGDPQDLLDSGFPQLEKELWKLLGANRGATMLVSAAVKLVLAVEELLEPVTAELTAIDKEQAAKAAAMEVEYEEAVKRLTALKQGEAAWRRQLQDGLDDLGTEGRNMMTLGFRDITTRSRDYLSKDSYLREPEQIPAMLETDIDALLIDVRSKIEVDASDLQGSIEETTGLNLTTSTVGQLRISHQGVSIGRVSGNLPGTFTKAMSVTREGLMTAPAGATLGGIIGGLLGIIGGPPGIAIGASIGAAIGGITGTVHGCQVAVKRLQNADKATLQREITPTINDMLRHAEILASDAVNKCCRDLKRKMRDELDRFISDELARYQNVQKTVAEARKRPAAERDSRIPKLQADKKRLEDLHAQVSQLLQQAMQASAANAAPPEPVSEPGDQGETGDWADA